jgi:hypothetical protein
MPPRPFCIVHPPKEKCRRMPIIIRRKLACEATATLI